MLEGDSSWVLGGVSWGCPEILCDGSNLSDNYNKSCAA
jgi:hypothetical protein